MLAIRQIEVHYGHHVAVEGLDLDVPDRQVVAVVGPSGCGKSTMLRAIAGLEPLVAGTVTIDGRRIDRLPPHRRRVGLMFQDHALFPHRSVADNIAFGLRMRGDTAASIDARVTEVLRLVDLDGAQQRAVSSLSGGEQQRIALARAIAPQPRVLMLDEPLGSLDRPLQRRLLNELPELLRAVGTATIYVTHDQDEALHLADRVAVMDRGRFVQVDEPRTLVRRPANAFVARFLGYDTLLPAKIEAASAVSDLGRTPLPDDWAQRPDNDVEAWVVLRPDAVQPADEADERATTVNARVTSARWLTDRCQ
jgi:thiamine transport system ATP-binding protein